MQGSEITTRLATQAHASNISKISPAGPRRATVAITYLLDEGTSRCREICDFSDLRTISQRCWLSWRSFLLLHQWAPKGLHSIFPDYCVPTCDNPPRVSRGYQSSSLKRQNARHENDEGSARVPDRRATAGIEGAEGGSAEEAYFH